MHILKTPWFNYNSKLKMEITSCKDYQKKELVEHSYPDLLLLILNMIKSNHIKDTNLLGLFKNLLQNSIESIKIIFPNEQDLNLNQITNEQLYTYLGIDPHIQDEELNELCLNELCFLELICKSQIENYIQNDLEAFEINAEIISNLNQGLENRLKEENYE